MSIFNWPGSTKNPFSTVAKGEIAGTVLDISVKQQRQEYKEQIRRREFAMEQAALACTGEPAGLLALADSIYQWLYGETK